MKSFSENRDLRATRLELADLRQLFELMVVDFEDRKREEDITVSCNLRNVSISENSLDSFLSHKDIPAILTRLSIEMTGWNAERNIDRRLSLSFYDNHITLSVSGKFQSWVLGKANQIEDFLRKKRSRFWFVHTAPAYALRGLVGVLIIAGSIQVTSRVLTGTMDNTTVLLDLAVLAAFALSYSVSRAKFVQIATTERKQTRQIGSLIFTIAMAVITIIGTIASLIPLLR